MGLRRYWSIVRRRWRLVALVLALTAAGGLVTLLGPRQYTAEVRVLLNRTPAQPPAATSDFRYDDYYRFLATEYVLDDLVEEVRGNRFAQAVADRLRGLGLDEAPGRPASDEFVMRSLKSERTHRILTVVATAPSRPLALAMANVVADLLTRDPAQYAPPDSSRVNSRVIHLDPVAHSDLARAILLYALQLVLGLVLAIGLALLLDSLDDRVRDADDAAALGLPLLARVPAAGARAR